MAPEIEPAVATRSRRCNARRLFRVPIKPRWRAPAAAQSAKLKLSGTGQQLNAGHQVICCGVVLWISGIGPLWNLTGFRASGNLSYGTGRTTNLPPLRGVLDPSAASRREGAAHVPVLPVLRPRPAENR